MSPESVENRKSDAFESVHSDWLNRPHVFIVGAPRSGTTWVQRLLLEHPRIVGGQETHFFSYFGHAIRQFEGQEGMQRKVGMPAYWRWADFRDMLLQAWEATYREVVGMKPHADLVLEKTPDHAVEMRAILKIMPNSRFVHVIRDSRAVVASLIAASRNWGRDWAPATATAAAQRWRHYVHAARSVGAELSPEQYIEVRYEDLQERAEEELRRLFAFLDIDVDEAFLCSAVDRNHFEHQVAMGGTPLPTGLSGNKEREPTGFFRSGRVDTWHRELSLFDKLRVLRWTWRLLKVYRYPIFRGLL